MVPFFESYAGIQYCDKEQEHKRDKDYRDVVVMRIIIPPQFSLFAFRVSFDTPKINNFVYSFPRNCSISINSIETSAAFRVYALSFLWQTTGRTGRGMTSCNESNPEFFMSRSEAL